MNEMQAIEIREPGGPDVLTPTTRTRPEPGPGEVLIRVAAAGINRPDVLQRMGFYPAPEGASDLPGLEVAGEVTNAGDGAENLIGQKVCALLPGGGYAEYAVADAALCLPVPDGFSMVEAAAMPETFFTVWTNVFEDAGLKQGERLLVHGGASGIGTTAIKLARAFGAESMTTAGSDEKCAALKELGATHAFNYREEDWEAAIRDLGGIDVVLDMVGGDYVTKNLACLRQGGRHVSIAFLRGVKAEIDIVQIMRKRLHLSGSTLRARQVEEKAAIATALREKVWPLMKDQDLTPVVDSTFPLARAVDAHRRMEESAHTGKIVLTIGDGET